MESYGVNPGLEDLRKIMSLTTQNVGVLAVLSKLGETVRVCTISSFNTYSISLDGEGFALFCLSANSLTGKYLKEQQRSSFHFLPTSAQSIAEDCSSAKEYELGTGDWESENGFTTFRQSKFTFDLDLTQVIESENTNIFLSRIVKTTSKFTDEPILKYHNRAYVK